MNKTIYDFFEQDHRRFENLLEKAAKDTNNVDLETYHEFRVGLLKHIKMEEKILFPAAQKANNDKPLPLAAKLRLDHGALTTLMVLPPTKDVIKVLRYVMKTHDILEEEKGGMYDLCENLTKQETEAILNQLKEVTEVPVREFNEADYALKAAVRCLERAGFDYYEIIR